MKSILIVLILELSNHSYVRSLESKSDAANFASFPRCYKFFSQSISQIVCGTIGFQTHITQDLK